MSKTLSIGISGRGLHSGVFTTEASNHWKGVTLYDDGELATKFRKAEVELGRQGFLDKAGTESAKRTAQNLGNPPKRDVNVRFKTVRGKPVAEISGPGFRKFEIRLTADPKSMKQVMQEVRKVINAVETVLLGSDHMGPAMV